MTHQDPSFQRLVQKLEPHGTLLRAWELAGGVSAQVTALEIQRPPAETYRVVVRRHGDLDLRRNPRVAWDEFRLLESLQLAGLAVPAPLSFDESGDIFSTPYVVLEYIEGQPEFAPSHLDDFIQQLATHLARIHQLDCSQLDLSFLPDQAERYDATFRERPATVDESLDEGRIRDVLESVWPLPRPNASALLHGDYWPGNTLWRDGRLVAVIDWEDAAVGDPLADVAITRLELVWAFGLDVMHRFTHAYRSLVDLDFSNLPAWDLCAALRPAWNIAAWAGDDATEVTMRAGHRLFVAQALAAHR